MEDMFENLDDYPLIDEEPGNNFNNNGNDNNNNFNINNNEANNEGDNNNDLNGNSFKEIDKNDCMDINNKEE